MIKIYKTCDGLVAQKQAGEFCSLRDFSLSELLQDDSLYETLDDLIESGRCLSIDQPDERALLAPIDQQEVWASGVTYRRSCHARMEESAAAGGGDFYDRVYDAARPELFFKSMPQHVVGQGCPVRIRRDAAWSVPEPELTLAINTKGRVVGYTIGNDMSARDIEGENPLYLPQAKIYDGGCAIGPCVVISNDPLPNNATISLKIERDGEVCISDAVELNQMKRTWGELADWLYREKSFPCGCFLMTGTGIVPPDHFTLRPGDLVSITFEPVGTLVNRVEL